MTTALHLGDCLDVLRAMPADSVDAVVTDPPYELGFMGKSWDASGIAFRADTWREVLRVMKPGGHLLAFAGSRTYHRIACAVEDAGFEIRDQIMWIYGSGFPKSLDVGKAIDKAAGAEREVVGVRQLTGYGKANVTNGQQQPFTTSFAETSGEPATDAARQWNGWGTALKPAHEPIVVARKPLAGTVAANVLAHGTGALNIDGCRIGADTVTTVRPTARRIDKVFGAFAGGDSSEHSGRWPANVIHDGSDEVVERFPDAQGQGGIVTGDEPSAKTDYVFGSYAGRNVAIPRCDTGSAARFFYAAKASAEDRDEGLYGFDSRAAGGMQGRNDGSLGSITVRRNVHPTVKPNDLMRYLVRLVTPLGGTVLDPFMGSGSTGKAAAFEGFDFVGIEREAEYFEIAKARIAYAEAAPKQVALELDAPPPDNRGDDRQQIDLFAA